MSGSSLFRGASQCTHEGTAVSTPEGSRLRPPSASSETVILDSMDQARGFYSEMTSCRNIPVAQSASPAIGLLHCPIRTLALPTIYRPAERRGVVDSGRPKEQSPATRDPRYRQEVRTAIISPIRFQPARHNNALLQRVWKLCTSWKNARRKRD